MKEGKFIGVGIGPGDPSLLTLKAVAALEKADVVCTPRSENSVDSIAWEIVKPFCKNRTIIDMSFSMAPVHTDRTVFWMRHARTIAGLCDEGKIVTFVTLGDPGLFSSFEYVVRLVRELRPSLDIEIIPGITSISASTAAIGMSLAQAEESITVQPCSKVLDHDLHWWKSFDCIVVMKIGKQILRLIGRLADLSLIENSVMVTRAGFNDSKFTRGKDLLYCKLEQGYLATVFVRPYGTPGIKGEN